MANFKLFGREINTNDLKKDLRESWDEQAQKASELWAAAGETVSETSGKVADATSEYAKAASDAIGSAADAAIDTVSESAKAASEAVIAAGENAIEFFSDEENQQMIKNKAIDTWVAIDEATDKVDAVLDDPLAQKLIPAPIMGAINLVRSPLTITKHIVNNYVVTDDVKEARQEARMQAESEQLADHEDDAE